MRSLKIEGSVCGLSGFGVWRVCLVVGIMVFVGGSLLYGQQPGEDGPCGGVVDCGLAPVPFGPLGWTEIAPAGNFFGWNPGGPVCWEFSEPIIGGSVLNVGNITEGLFWTSPYPAGPPGKPAFGGIVAGQVGEIELTGTTIHSGGCGCVSSIRSGDVIGNAVAVTDEVIAALFVGRVAEYELPEGSLPLSNVAVGFKLRWNWAFLGYFVETDAPSMEFLLGGRHTRWDLPAARVDAPDSWNGDLLGVGFIHYTNDAVYTANLLGGDELEETVLPSPYSWKEYIGMNGVRVHMVDGNDVDIFVPGIVVEFGPCDQPMRCCRDATNSFMAVNINPAFSGDEQIDAASADWPMTLATCRSFGEQDGPNEPPPVKAGDGCPDEKIAGAYAYAYATGGNADRDGWNWEIVWQDSVLCQSDMAYAFAMSIGDGLAMAEAWITAECPNCPPGDDLEIDYGLFAFADADFFTEDPVYSRARAVAAVADPIVFDDWDGSKNLELKLGLASNTYLQMPRGADIHSGSVSVYYLEAGTTLPAYENLLTARITAHAGVDGNMPTLDVNVVSNPLLGLYDSTIEYEIENALAYNDANGGFGVESHSPFASISVDVPNNVEAFEVRTRAASVLEFFGSEYSGPELASPGKFCGNAIIEQQEAEMCDPPWCGCDEDCHSLDTLYGDADGDGTVNIFDYLLLGRNWRARAYIRADLDNNGMIDLYDMAYFAQDWLMETSWYPCP